MRLLTSVHDPSLAWDILSLLKDKGIPTYVKVTGFFNGFGVRRQQIFVCLDAHFEDAQALLRDPDHQVRHPVDVDAFDLEAQGVDGRQVKWGVIVLAVVVLTLVAYFWVLDVPVWPAQSQ